METNDSKMQRFASRISDKKLQLFTRLLKKNLLAAGIDEALFDNVAQATTLELHIQESQNDLMNKALQSFENRGIDTVGRIMVEYCFIRSATGKMIWPEYSDEDTSARWNFDESILPRPLMRYFLVSVRGPIEEIDEFSTDSFLFDTPDAVTALRKNISDLIDDFKGPFGSGETAVDWQAVYEDSRFKQLAFSVISDMLSKLDERGLDSYLSCLEAYRQADPKSKETNLMERPLTLLDVQQIKEALTDAKSRLREPAH